MWCPGCLLQWVRCCSDSPLFVMFVGSMSHIRVAVKFVCVVRVAVGMWKGVLRCISQRCCSAMVLPSVCCSGCVVGRVTVCVAVELLCIFFHLCAVRVAVGVLTQWVWCSLCDSGIFCFFIGAGLAV